MQQLVARLNERFRTRLSVAAVENVYFGSEIVVAGLMTGACVLKTRAQIAGEFVIIPSAAFKSDEMIMLDGMTHATLAARLGLPVHALDFAGLSRLLLSPQS
jgi:NifB/MoaA-like Fe-S oxidoreductase